LVFAEILDPDRAIDAGLLGRSRTHRSDRYPTAFPWANRLRLCVPCVPLSDR
jgi:hypothetical protein